VEEEEEEEEAAAANHYKLIYNDGIKRGAWNIHT
jgi:hypothetical protein